jgi:hypothetical protein
MRPWKWLICYDGTAANLGMVTLLEVGMRTEGELWVLLRTGGNERKVMEVESKEAGAQLIRDIVMSQAEIVDVRRSNLARA